MTKGERIVIVGGAMLFTAGVGVLVAVLYSIGALRMRRPLPWGRGVG